MKRFLRWVSAASSLLFVCVTFLPPDQPQPGSPLDDSWMEILHFAFLHHLQFGRGLVFTFGPWGFLYGGYQPDTHPVSVVAWLMLAIVFWFGARRMAAISFENELGRWAWLMALTAFASVIIAPTIDERLICFPLLLIMLHFFDKRRFATLIQCAVLVSLGLLSLVRFTVFILSAGMVVATAVDTVWRRRRAPWGLAVFSGSLLLFWLIARQEFSSIGSYLRSSWEMTSGYTEAMMKTAPREMEFAGGFLVVAFALCGAVAFCLWKRLRFFGAILLAALGLIVFTTFKYSFVRDDGPHQAAGAVELLIVCLVCLAIEWPVVREQLPGIRAVIFLPIIAAYVFVELSFGRFDLTPFASQFAGAFSPEKWVIPLEGLFRSNASREAYRLYLANYRERFPLPPLQGDVDSYSWNQIELFANGAAPCPRPVFQSYSAYTPRLGELNAAHLRTDEAAHNIIWDGFALDDRYRSLDDALSWPELLTRYDVQQVEVAFALLARSPTPRQFTLNPFLNRSVKFGEDVSLPPISNEVVWAEIEVERSKPGSLVSTLYKPPKLVLNTTLDSGQHRADRFIPGIALRGFVLSPVVRNSAAFAALASAHWPKLLTGNEVTGFSITQSDTLPLIECYKNAIHVRLYRLDYPKQDSAGMKGYGHAIELIDMVQKANRLQDGQYLYLEDEGSVFGVPADSAMLFDQPPGSSRLRLAFGMYVPDGQSNTNGVTFQVFALNAQGKNLIWSRNINPARSPKDHGKQDATVELIGQEISRIALETVSDPGSTNEVLRPYWSEIHFE